MECTRRLSEKGNPYCIYETNPAVSTAEDIVKGAYMQMRDCPEPSFQTLNETNGTIAQYNFPPISQAFFIKYTCAPGCEFEFLENGICDPECDNKGCNYDAAVCTNSPTSKPTGKPKTSFPTKATTGGFTLAPSSSNTTATPTTESNVTFSPSGGTIAPTTFRPTVPPTKQPDYNETTIAPTYNETAAPTFIPTRQPTETNITFTTIAPSTTEIPTFFPTAGPTMAYVYTYPPTKDYESMIAAVALQLEQIQATLDNYEEHIFEIETMLANSGKAFTAMSKKVDSTLQGVAEQAEALVEGTQQSQEVAIGLLAVIFVIVIVHFLVYLFYACKPKGEGLSVPGQSVPPDARLRRIDETLDGLSRKVDTLVSVTNTQMRVQISGSDNTPPVTGQFRPVPMTPPLYTNGAGEEARI